MAKYIVRLREEVYREFEVDAEDAKDAIAILDNGEPMCEYICTNECIEETNILEVKLKVEED